MNINLAHSLGDSKYISLKETLNLLSSSIESNASRIVRGAFSTIPDHVDNSSSDYFYLFPALENSGRTSSEHFSINGRKGTGGQGRVLLIDLGSPEEYQRYHIYGAVNISGAQLSSLDQNEQKRTEWVEPIYSPETTALIFYSRSGSGVEQQTSKEGFLRCLGITSKERSLVEKHINTIFPSPLSYSIKYIACASTQCTVETSPNLNDFVPWVVQEGCVYSTPLLQHLHKSQTLLFSSLLTDATRMALKENNGKNPQNMPSNFRVRETTAFGQEGVQSTSMQPCSRLPFKTLPVEPVFPSAPILVRSDVLSVFGKTLQAPHEAPPKPKSTLYAFDAVLAPPAPPISAFAVSSQKYDARSRYAAVVKEEKEKEKKDGVDKGPRRAPSRTRTRQEVAENARESGQINIRLSSSRQEQCPVQNLVAENRNQVLQPAQHRKNVECNHKQLYGPMRITGASSFSPPIAGTVETAELIDKVVPDTSFVAANVAVRPNSRSRRFSISSGMGIRRNLPLKTDIGGNLI